MHKSPEPTEHDVARAATATAQQVYDGSDGRLTVAFYRRLQALGPFGIVAMNLFRAHKTSSRAKVYRGRQFRGAAYETKNYSLDQLVTALRAEDLTLVWGWQKDPSTPGYEWVIYVDLPTGQASFHTAARLPGPDYPGKWDGQHLSRERILAFVDSLLGHAPDVEAGDLTAAIEDFTAPLESVHPVDTFDKQLPLGIFPAGSVR